MATVSQAHVNGRWSLPRGRHPLTLLLRQCLSTAPPPTSDQPDFFLWRNSLQHTPDCFSSSKTWQRLHPSGIEVIWYNSVWFKERIPKHAFLAWVVARDRMPTRDRLRRWGLQVPATCLLCHSSDESIEHLFFTCTYSIAVWAQFFSQGSLTPPLLLQDIFSWTKTASNKPKLNTICKLILQGTIYELWKERNSRLHGFAHKLATLKIKEIQLSIRTKLASLDTACPASVPSSSVGSVRNETYLSTWFGFIQR